MNKKNYLVLCTTIFSCLLINNCEILFINDGNRTVFIAETDEGYDGPLIKLAKSRSHTIGSDTRHIQCRVYVLNKQGNSNKFPLLYEFHMTACAPTKELLTIKFSDLENNTLPSIFGLKSYLNHKKKTKNKTNVQKGKPAAKKSCCHQTK
jgi:hypothetical protein